MSAAVSPYAFAAVDRGGAASGTIVSANGDEEVRFVQEQGWRGAEIAQALLAGDSLRTGPAGALALRFVDQTLIRMHRNSALIVKRVLAAGAAQLRLDAGRIWARADEAGSGVDVETPSATVAIRGTDWSLAVDGTRTTLIVIFGEVVMANAQGSVTVRRGEAAIAEIGRAPAKIILANPPGREQLLYYTSLRDAFGWLPLTALSPRDLRRRYGALQQVPPTQRTAADWLDMAEAGVNITGRSATREAVGRARAFGRLSRRDEARATLVEGLLAAAGRDWLGAAALFAKAEPALSGERRFAALFGRYLALAIAGRREEAALLLPAIERFRGTRSYILGQAWVRSNIGEIEGALSDLAQAHRRHPEDTAIAVMAAELAMLLAREDDARGYMAKALALDPDDPDALNAEAMLLSDYEGQVDLAVARIERAIASTPGYSQIWGTLGLLRSDQGDFGGSADAYRKAIALDPDDPVAHANFAVTLLDADRLDPAREQLDLLRGLDPSFSVALLAEGRWLIQQGRMQEAQDAFLDAVVANPGLSNSYLALAIGYYEQGDLARAEQALANANNLDSDDPLVALFETVIALDHAEADRAIVSAREAYRRYRARGGVENPFAATREGGSYLNSAFGELSLDDWGRFYGDLTFNPFDAGSQFYQAAALRTDLLESGSAEDGSDLGLAPILQGLLIDPLSVSSRNRYTDLFRRPFLDTTLSSGADFNRDGYTGWLAGAEVQGYAYAGAPMAFNVSGGVARTDPSTLDQSNDDAFANLFFGTSLTLRDNLFLLGSFSRFEDDVPEASAFLGGENDADTDTYAAGGGYSHSFGARNNVMGAFFATRTRTEAGIEAIDEDGFRFAIDASDREEGLFAGMAHNVEIGRFTFRYGAEGQTIDRRTDAISRLAGIPLDIQQEHGEGLQGQVFGDVQMRLGERLMLQGGLYYAGFDDGIDPSSERVDPRLGIAWLAGDGQWLRAVYREETQLSISTSLAPVTTLGLIAGATPVEPGGARRSAQVRWDAEWTDRFFTAVELERQEVEGYVATIRDTFDPLGDLAVEDGVIERASVFANAWMGHGIGLFGRLTVAHSENTSGDANDGERLPLVPDWQASFGMSWVHPSQLRVSVAQNLIGQRAGDDSGTTIDSAATTNVNVTWQPFDKHVLLSAAALNIFDADYELATGIEAPGTTFLVRGELRF